MRRRWHDLSRAERFDLVRVWVWIVLIPIAYCLEWMNAVTAVFLLSIYANIASDYAAFRGGDERLLREIDAKLDRLLNADGRPEERPS